MIKKIELITIGRSETCVLEVEHIKDISFDSRVIIIGTDRKVYFFKPIKISREIDLLEEVGYHVVLKKQSVEKLETIFKDCEIRLANSEENVKIKQESCYC